MDKKDLELFFTYESVFKNIKIIMFCNEYIRRRFILKIISSPKPNQNLSKKKSVRIKNSVSLLLYVAWKMKFWVDLLLETFYTLSAFIVNVLLIYDAYIYVYEWNFLRVINLDSRSKHGTMF